jgi:hypothetical protein
LTVISGIIKILNGKLNANLIAVDSWDYGGGIEKKEYFFSCPLQFVYMRTIVFKDCGVYNIL